MLSQGMAHDRISVDPRIMSGKPVIRGTRVTVEQVLRDVAAGCPPEQIADMYPTITCDDVRAALIYAADAVGRGTPLAA